MEFKDQKEAKNISNFLDDFPSLKVKPYNQSFDFKDDYSTIEDYASLVTIKALRQKPEYYLAKWDVMMKRLICFDEHFYCFDKKEIIFRAKQTINSIVNKNIEKKNKSSISENISFNISSNSSSEIISDELSLTIYNDDENSNGHISEEVQSIKPIELNLHYKRKNIIDINFDEIDETDYKIYAKRTIFAMLILLKLYNFEILQPKDVFYNKLLNMFKIEENEIFFETFKMDMVINGLLLNDIKSLIDNYPKHFFFEDQLKINEENLNDKVNIVSEISKDLIKDIGNKLNREKKYINILKAFDKYRTEEIVEIINENNKKTLDSLMIDINNESLFILITNGSYFLLKFAINILKSLFKQNNIEEKEINKIIQDKVDIELNKKNNSLIYYLIHNKKKFCGRLYKFYLFFDDLRKNNVRHCLLYIGEESGTEFEDGIISIMNLNKTQTVKDDLKLICKTKNIIDDLSRIKKDSDAIIKKFCKDIKESIINNSKQIRDIFESYTLKDNDYLTIKIYVPKENEKNINEIYNYKNFNYKIKAFDSNEKLKVYDNILENKSDIIWIIEDDTYFIYKLMSNPKTGQNIIAMPYKIIDYFFEIVLERMKIEYIKTNCYSSCLSYINDNIIQNKEILNIDKLLLKIKTELGIKIDKDKINDLFKVTIDNDKLKKIKSVICNNFEKLNELLEIKNYEKIYNSIEKAYDKNILILMENIKASALYDYIYFTLLPDIKYEKMQEFYQKLHNDNDCDKI